MRVFKYSPKSRRWEKIVEREVKELDKRFEYAMRKDKEQSPNLSTEAKFAPRLK